MLKTLLIILSVLQVSLSFAQTTSQTLSKQQEIIDSPGVAATNIMLGALSSFKDLKKANQASLENTKSLVNIKILPFLDLETSSKIALSTHWDQLKPAQQQLFIDYIRFSFVKDYIGMLHSYKELATIEINLHKKIQRKGNKAIVKLEITPHAGAKMILVSFKMIKKERWKIYDVVFVGVSVVKNYRAQFNSHIKRKGMDSLIKKITARMAE